MKPFLVAFIAWSVASALAAQNGTVVSHQKISDTMVGVTATLGNNDLFGPATSLGDLNGDGVIDLAVGAIGDDDGSLDSGAVWILFLNADGTVGSHQKISPTDGGFTGTLDEKDSFGGRVASLGDLDGDGVIDLAVGAAGDDDGASCASVSDALPARPARSLLLEGRGVESADAPHANTRHEEESSIP